MAGLLGFLVIVPQTLTHALGSGGPAARWIPRLGTEGQTIVFYNYADDVTQFVLVPLLVIAFAYWIGQRSDLEHDRSALVRGLLIGGLGVFLGRAIALLGLARFGGTNVDLLNAFLFVGVDGIGLFIQIVTAGITGLALAYLRFESSWKPSPKSDEDTSARSIDG